jgi:hypothetical protein
VGWSTWCLAGAADQAASCAKDRRAGRRLAPARLPLSDRRHPDGSAPSWHPGEGDASADTAEPARQNPGPQAPALAVFDQRKSRAAISSPASGALSRPRSRPRRIRGHCGATLESNCCAITASPPGAGLHSGGRLDRRVQHRPPPLHQQHQPHRLRTHPTARTRSGRRLTTVRWHR